MVRKLLYLMSFVLAVGLVGSASAAEIKWMPGSVNNLWSNNVNWDPAQVPTAIDNANFYHEANEPNFCLINAFAECYTLRGPGYRHQVVFDINGDVVTSAPSTLTIDGATITVGLHLMAGYADDGYGILNIQPGSVLDVTRNFYISGAGQCVVNMNGGAVYAKTLRLGTTGTGQLNLDGGTVDVNSIGINSNSVVDISGGTLIIDGLSTGAINSYSMDGLMVAHGGRGRLTSVETTGPNRTTVTAAQDLAIAYDLNLAGVGGVVHDALFTWKPGDGVTLHHVYLSTEFNDVNEATGPVSPACISGAGIGANSIDPDLKFGVTYYWRVDEDTNRGNIRRFSTDDGKAQNPIPADGATGVGVLEVDLDWIRKPGRVPYPVTHNVYFSESYAEVNDVAPGNTAPLYCIAPGIGPNTVHLNQLKLDTTYYWRVDEVVPMPDPCVVKGDVWDFTTSNSYVIDNIESYSSDFYTEWQGTGNIISSTYYGLHLGAYIHGGVGAIWIWFDNYWEPYYGGVSRTETPWDPADWTFDGSAETLSLWFYGDPNLAKIHEMYVRLKDNLDREAVTYYTDNWPASNFDIDNMYQEWNIALTEFTDFNPAIDLTNVKTLEIGVGDPYLGVMPPKTGNGYLYLDDIRLYARRCVLEYGQPGADINDDCVVDKIDLSIMAGDWLDYDYSITGVAVASDDPNLVAHWKLDESDPCTVAVDSSGNGHHGTVDYPAWDPNGKIDGAIFIDDVQGLEYVDCGGGKNKGEPNTWADIDGEITVMAWVKSLHHHWWHSFDYIVGKGDESAWELQKAWHGSLRPGAVSFYVDVPGVPWYGLVGETVIDDTMWHHVAGVYEIHQPGVSSEVLVYTDGAKEGSLVCSGSPIGTCKWPVTIGGDIGSLMIMMPHPWLGHIDDVRIYDRALSQVEVLGVMKEAPIGPVAQYEFETEAGGITPDSSGGHDGTLVNGASIVYDADRDSNVLELNGVDAYVELADSGHDLNEPNCTDEPGNCTWADITGKFTIAAWVKPDISDSGNYRAVVFGKGDDGGYHRDYPSEPNRPREGWSMLRLNRDNVVTIAVTGTPKNFTPVQGIVPNLIDVNIWDGKWHHIAAVFDSAFQYVYYYIDGVIAESHWVSWWDEFSAVATTNYPIWIGANVGEVLGGGVYADGYHGWKGRIDDVRIYDRALTEFEIANVMGGADVYVPLESLANLYDEELINNKIINFRDYQILANGWLEDEMFPFRD